MRDTIRAGVIGASGIGKHHAKWLNALGCDVVGFAGTSQQSVDATSEALAGLLGFSGEGCVGAGVMLDTVRPDVVAICSPPWLHHEHFLLAAERGCHIMCEKPLVWDPDKETSRLLDEGRQMVGLAREQGIVTAINTQYVAEVPPYLQLCQQAGHAVSPHEFTEFFSRMDSRGGKQGASGEKIWIDLASHPLSVLMAFAGPGSIAPGSANCEIGEKGITATFDYATTSGRQVRARIEVCNVPEGTMFRQIGIDNMIADYEGRNDEDGVYCAYLRLGDAELKTTDFVQTSISRFVDAVRHDGEPLTSLEDGLNNLQMQLHLLEVGRGQMPRGGRSGA